MLEAALLAQLPDWPGGARAPPAQQDQHSSLEARSSHMANTKCVAEQCRLHVELRVLDDTGAGKHKERFWEAGWKQVWEVSLCPS